MAKFLLLKCFFLIFFCSCESYKILVVFGFPGKSHAILGNELVKLLSNDGHEVTYIAAGKYSGPRENISLIDVSDIDTLSTDTFLSIENIMNNLKSLNLKLQRKMMSTLRIFKFWNATIHHRKVQDLVLNSSQKFDAVIVDWIYSEMASGFAAIHQCPLIWFSTMEPDWSVLRLIDGIPNPAYSIDFTTEYVPPFTFLQRVKQLWALIYTYSYHAFVMNPQEEESYKKAFLPAAKMRGLNLPSLQENKFNASLMLGISNAIISGDISLPQNYKHIGGYHIDDQLMPLPENLQTKLNKSKNGFIYFSMGSRINTRQMPEKIKRELINMFGCLNYTVLWKLEEDQPDLPPNVFTVKWAPQQSVLAHPNIKLFITHGGLLSMTEAVHFAVPLIGIPGYADQQLNVQRASAKGFCIRVDLSYDLATNLKLAINEILNNARYKQAIDQLSQIYHYRMMPARKEITFWMRHVIESNNTQYLRSAALIVPWYQKIFLDLALFLIFGIIFVSVILCQFLKQAFLFGAVFISFMSRLLWNKSLAKHNGKLKQQ